MSIPRRSNHVLIDGDVICYAVGFASQKSTWSLEGKTFDEKKLVKAYADKLGIGHDAIASHITTEPVEFALSSAKRMLKNITAKAKGQTYDVILTGGNNFREDVATLKPYKGQRVQPKPVHFQAIKDYLMEVQSAILVEGEEADDYLSYTALEHGYTIATIDKDLDNTEGWHYNWKRDELYYVTVRDSRVHFYTQLLTGDTTDNIPSLFQITGKRCSAKIKAGVLECDTEIEMYEYVWGVWDDARALHLKDEDEERYHTTTTEILTEIGILLHMRRTEGEIWTPPTR